MCGCLFRIENAMSCLQDSAAEIEMTLWEWYEILPNEFCWIDGVEKRWEWEWIQDDKGDK
jgi:hypothetical protein